MKVIIHNNVYDITTFIPEHPGGTAVFSAGEGEGDCCDFTEKFNAVGHSEYAVNLLENYKVHELSEDDPRFRRDCRLEYNKTKISKLITHEDKFHIHKFMGVASLLNYFYLFFDCFYSGATATLTLRRADSPAFIALTWIHTVLSLSALQFLIPRTRTGILPMIWQEFRAHSIIFAVRSFLIINLLHLLQHMHLNISSWLIRTACVLLAMKLADISTHYLRENRKETTTATMPYWSDCNPRLQASIKYFYTHSQFMATITCLFSDAPYILAVAFPIQIASFLMTLVRKNIIPAFWYHALYAGSLLIVYLINAADITLYPICAVGVGLIHLRVNVKLNKYVLWMLVSVIGGLLQEPPQPQLVLYIGLMVVFPLATVYAYHFKPFTLEPATIFGAWITTWLFDTCRREESNHRVVSNTVSCPTFNRIVIQLCEPNISYKPGMYFNLYFNTQKRPYTPVAYDQSTNVATFLIKHVTGGEVSPLLCEKYCPGRTVFVKGPFGRKYYDPSPNVQAFVCDGQPIRAKVIIMCSCGSGITPFYSMGMSWLQSHHKSQHQELHYLSSYRHQDDAVLRIPSSVSCVRERLFISSENTRLTPGALIDYLGDIVDNRMQYKVSDIAVFICGTKQYGEMVKETCSIYSEAIPCYEW
jgi:ferredoxin-NADP reductase/lipid-A-disaccharide synthase-like uncharacterized protein